MEKMTVKEFKNALYDNASRFIGSYFMNAEKGIDEKRIIAGMDKVKPERLSAIPTRQIEHVQSNAMRFTGGSWLYFYPGKKYFCHVTAAGLKFLITESFDEDGSLNNMIVYAI